MPSAQIIYGDFKRSVGQFATAPLINLYAEKSPTTQEKTVDLILRPALVSWIDTEDPPLRGVFCRSGLFDGDALILSNQTVYRVTEAGVVTALSGTVAGRNRVRIDGGLDLDGNALARIATGTQLYQTDGVTVTAEDFPDVANAGCADICYHRQHWIGIEAGTDKVYLQLPGDTTWDALTYAAAEYQPDPAVFVRSLGDQVWIGGTDSTEVWALTGDPADPITPYGGLKFDYGCLHRDTAVNLPNALMWVDNNYSVRLTSGGQPEIVSDNGIAEQIRQCPEGEVRAWSFTIDQHLFYVPTLCDDATLVFDLSTRLWSRWKTQEMETFVGHLGTNVGTITVALSSDVGSGKVYKFDPDETEDTDGEIEAQFSAMVENAEAYARCPMVEVIGSVGFVPRTLSAEWRMRYSDTQGKTWSNWKTTEVPATGEYAGRVRFRQLANFKPPYGRWFEIRNTGAGVRRIHDVRYVT